MRQALVRTVNRWINRFKSSRTKITPEQQVWLDWCRANIKERAGTVQEVYGAFNHLIEVNPAQFLSDEGFGTWNPVDDYSQYHYPNRQLGNHAIWGWFRGKWVGEHGNRVFTIDEIGGEDRVFVATNNEEDALWIAIKWGR